MTEIRCSGCGALLAMQDEGKVEARHGKRAVRFYGVGVAEVVCPFCTDKGEPMTRTVAIGISEKGG